MFFCFKKKISKKSSKLLLQLKNIAKRNKKK